MSFHKQIDPRRGRRTAVAIALGIASLLVAGTSCSSGPQPPQPGSPAFFWAAAKETHRAGDYIKTSEHLQRILASENEFAARARAWDTVISAGVTQAYIELADVYEGGARMNRANPTPFRKEVSRLRSLASASAIQFTEDVHKLMEADKGPEILLAFDLPAGTSALPAGLKRVSGGILVQDSEQAILLSTMLQRGVLLSASAAAGNPDDTAAAAEKFKGGEVKISRDAFLLNAGKALQQQSELFTGTKLDQPNRLKMMSQVALEALKAIPPSKETKAITDKITAGMKKANIT